MEHLQFERMVEEEFEVLPELFKRNLENVRIIVEELPPPERRQGGSILLGLYEGVPLNRRGTGYGMYPVVPDTITLYQKNIERIAQDEIALRRQVRATLIHEIGHYYGMTEAEIRRAGY